MRVLGYDWQPQSLGRLAGYRAALSAIRTENAEWVSRFRAIPIGIGEIMGSHSKKVSVRTVVLLQLGCTPQTLPAAAAVTRHCLPLLQHTPIYLTAEIRWNQ